MQSHCGKNDDFADVGGYLQGKKGALGSSFSSHERDKSKGSRII